MECGCEQGDKCSGRKGGKGAKSEQKGNEEKVNLKDLSESRDDGEMEAGRQGWQNNTFVASEGREIRILRFP